MQQRYGINLLWAVFVHRKSAMTHSVWSLFQPYTLTEMRMSLFSGIFSSLQCYIVSFEDASSWNAAIMDCSNFELDDACLLQKSVWIIYSNKVRGWENKTNLYFHLTSSFCIQMVLGQQSPGTHLTSRFQSLVNFIMYRNMHGSKKIVFKQAGK